VAADAARLVYDFGPLRARRGRVVVHQYLLFQRVRAPKVVLYFYPDEVCFSGSSVNASTTLKQVKSTATRMRNADFGLTEDEVRAVEALPSSFRLPPSSFN
jgi:peroxiredoxin